MKILQIMIGLALILTLFVWGLSSYLAPDDLRECGDHPSYDASLSTECKAVDAIVAVSGGDTSARAAEAIRLYQNGWARMLIFSGSAADKSGPSNAAVMMQQAIDAGVDPNSIIIEEKSESTAENATETSELFKTHDVSTMILVTSGYHQRRASLEFQRNTTGVKVLSHPVMSDKHWGPWWWLTPNGWALAIPEFITSLVLSTGGVARE